MEHEFRIRVQVGQPAAASPRRLAADVEPTVDVVHDDLDPALLAALAAGRRNVDHRHRPGERITDLVVEPLGYRHPILYKGMGLPVAGSILSLPHAAGAPPFDLWFSHLPNGPVADRS